MDVTRRDFLKYSDSALGPARRQISTWSLLTLEAANTGTASPPF
jgi:hypothetical protein